MLRHQRYGKISTCTAVEHDTAALYLMRSMARAKMLVTDTNAKITGGTVSQGEHRTVPCVGRTVPLPTATVAPRTKLQERRAVLGRPGTSGKSGTNSPEANNVRSCMACPSRLWSGHQDRCLRRPATGEQSDRRLAEQLPYLASDGGGRPMAVSLRGLLFES